MVVETLFGMVESRSLDLLDGGFELRDRPCHNNYAGTFFSYEFTEFETQPFGAACYENSLSNSVS